VIALVKGLPNSRNCACHRCDLEVEDFGEYRVSSDEDSNRNPGISRADTGVAQDGKGAKDLTLSAREGRTLLETSRA